MKNKGWKNESMRHSASAKGVKTTYKRLTGQTLSRYETDEYRYRFIDEWGYFDQEHFDRWLQDKTGKVSYKTLRNQHSLMTGFGQPKIDMRKRFLVGSSDDISYATSLNPLEYIKYLKLEDDYEQGNISREIWSKKIDELGNIVQVNNRMIDHYWDADENDAKYELYFTYMKLNMLDEAIETRNELNKRGFRNWDIYIQKEEDLKLKLEANGTIQKPYMTKQEAELEHLESGRSFDDSITSESQCPMSVRWEIEKLEKEKRKKEQDEEFDRHMRKFVRENPHVLDSKEPKKTKKKLEIDDVI